MIELIGGVYYLGDGVPNPSNPGQGYFHNGPPSSGDPPPPPPPTKAPALSKNGTIAGRIGTRAKPIIFCGNNRGSTRTVIDGADSKKYKAIGIRVLLSKRVVVAGFTFRNLQKGMRGVLKSL